MGRGKVEFKKGPGGLLVPTPGARLLGLEGGPAPDQVQMQRHLVGQGSTSCRSGVAALYLHHLALQLLKGIEGKKS